MAYTAVNWSAASGRETAAPTAKQMGDIDRALVDYEVRIVALVAALAALEARVLDLETP